MEKKFKIWTDSESAIEIPDHVEQYYDDYDEAYWAASELVHEHDGQTYRAIVHLEDLELEETIDTFENLNPKLSYM